MADIQLDLFSQAAPEPEFLVFDTETTGLPRSWQAPVTALDNWPRMVQLAYMAFDRDGGLITAHDCLIKPRGFTIPAESARASTASRPSARWPRGGNCQRCWGSSRRCWTAPATWWPTT